MSEVTSKSKSAKEDRPRSRDEILGPSKEEKAAAAFNRKHPELAAEFRKLTGVDATNNKAVKAWQLAHNLPSDGKIGPGTVKAAKAAAPKQQGQAEVEGERSAVPAASVDAEPAQAADEEQATMDPSVEALFQQPTKSTDEEMHTDGDSVSQQAASCRLALEKHLTEFEHASTVATKLALGDAAGMGKKVKSDQYGIEKMANIAKVAIKLAWSACGGAAQIGEVLKIAKEELLGPMEEYAEKAYEFTKGKIEKNMTEVSLPEVTKHIASAATLNTTTFVERAKAHVGKMDANALAQTWRLIAGTRENMTVKGEKLDEGQKEIVTTVMLEQMTGIEVGGEFAMRLANTLRQQALVDFASLMSNPGERAAAMGDVLRGEVPEQTKRIAGESGDAAWVHKDSEKRASVRE